jgi:hypothetical protein
LLAGTKTFAQLAKERGVDHIKTDLALKESNPDKLKKATGLIADAFELTDPVMVLSVRKENNYYLARLVEAEIAEETEESDSDDRLEGLKSSFVEGFIASLGRTATIEWRADLTLDKAPSDY